MASLFRMARRHLPPPLAGWLRRRRRQVVRLTTGVDVESMAARTAAVREEILAALEQRTLDLLDRQDAILASYDRRVAAVVNRVLDLEERDVGLRAQARAAVEPDPEERKLLEARLELHRPLLGENAPVVELGDGDPLAALAGHVAGSAGAVTVVGVVESLYLDEVDRLFRAVWRVLRRGGVVVVESLYPTSAESLARFWRDPSRLRPWDASALAWLVRRAGLEVVDVRPHPGEDADYALVARRP